MEYIIEMKAKVIVDQTLVLSDDGRYEARIKVLAVTKNEKFPTGIKSNYVLLDTREGIARLLIDNHEPFGFHMHTKLPKEPEHREKLDTDDHEEALQIFFLEAERIMRDEKK